MHRLLVCSLAAVLALGSVAISADVKEVKSGLQPGEPVGPFEVEKCAGAKDDGQKVGENFCYRCMLGARPVVMVFTRKVDKNMDGLVKELDKLVAKNADKKLASFVNLIGENPKELKAAAKVFGDKNKLEKVAVVVPQDNKNGPEEFHINPKTDVTVMIYREGVVVANHALESSKLSEKEVKRVLADTAKILK